MTSPIYSNRLGRIAPAQFQEALDRFDLGDYIHAEPVPYGLFGQNVFLTSTKGNFVLRGAPHSAWQFPTECFFTNLLHHHTKTPVAYPYLVEPDPGIFGWSYAIMPRLPGLILPDKNIKEQLHVSDRLEIARAVARMLVEIQTLTWNGCGSFNPDANRVEPFETNYRERIVQNIHEKLDDARQSNENTTRSDLQYIDVVLARAESVLHLPFQPTVVIGDYGEHNLVVERNNGQWQVSGVFDLMTAHFGDGAADIAGPVMGYLKEDANLANAFVQDYLLSKPATSGFREYQQLYMLDLALSIWRYFQKHEGGLPDDKTKKWTFEQWAKPLIDYWM